MNFWRASSHLRLAAYFAALLTASGMIVFGATYFAIAASSKNTLRQLVDTDLAGLVELYAVEGVEGLEQRIGDRLKLRPAQGAEAFYLFADGEGAILAGNLPDWPDGARLDSSLFEATFPGPDGPVRVVGRATILRGDYGLLVARSEEVRRAALARELHGPQHQSVIGLRRRSGGQKSGNGKSDHGIPSPESLAQRVSTTRRAKVSLA